MQIQPPTTKFEYHYELHYSMRKTHRSPSTFEQFKRCVRESIRDLSLDEHNRILTRKEWRKLIQMVLTTEPALRRYEDYWPIRQYTKSYLRNLKRYGKKYRGRIGKGKQPKVPSRYDSSYHKRRSSKKSTLCTIIDLDVIELTSREGTPQPEPSTMATRDPTPLSPLHQQLPLTPPVSGTSSSLPPRSVSPSRVTVTALCCMCSCTPWTKIDSFLNKGLVRQFGDDPCILFSLLSFGIYFDHHLDFIIGLDTSFRTEIINSIPFENASAKRKFMEALNKLLQAPRVSEPSTYAQNQLLVSDYTHFEQRLQDAMHETNYENFQRLMEIMHAQSTRFFDIGSPVVHHLRATIRQIVQERPEEFAQYTNYWPIRLYLSRRNALIGCIPQYDERQEREAFAAVFEELTQPLGNVNTSCRAARVMVEQVPCKIHKPVDLTGVSATIRDHLSDLGVAELLPAFVQNGIRTYDDLELRLQTGMDLGLGVRLSSLQKFMLDLLRRFSPG